MASHPPPYEKFHNPDEQPQVAGQVPAGYPGYPGAPITFNQTVNAPSPGQHTVVVTQPAATNTVIVAAPIRPASYMWLSCVVYWCCNCIAGGIAFALSVASSNAADENRMEEARSYGRASMWTSVIGVAVGVVILIIFVIIWATVLNKATDEINDLNDNYNSYNG